MSAAIIPEIVDAVLTFAPQVMNIPVLGRLLTGLGVGPIIDEKAIEQLQGSIDQRKSTRTRTQNQNNKRVIKVKDALQCVDRSVNNPAVILKFGRAMAGVIAGGTQSIGEILYKEIETCILKNRLGQSSVRSGNIRRTSSHRPSKGHGTGKKSVAKR